MEAASEEARIRRAWELSEDWFVHKAEHPEEGIHLLFSGVSLSDVRRTFEFLEEHADRRSSGAVWADPESFRPESIGIDQTVDALEVGNLLATGVNYEIESEGFRIQMVLTVLRRDRKTEEPLSARGYTEYGRIAGGGATPREGFSALLRHAIDLQAMLGARALHAGPEGKTTADAPEGTWVTI